MQKISKSVLITVGSTEFDQLMQALDQEAIWQLFEDHNYTTLWIQKGRGKYTPTKFTSKLKVDVFDYKPNIGPIQKEADLIISHCGAGTLLECLRLKKKVCAVINETLMDNHQIELLKALKGENYIFGIETLSNIKDQLEQVFQNLERRSLKEYEIQEKNILDRIINVTV